MVAFVAMALVLTTEQASADGATLPALSMPHLSWSALADWFQDPTWGHIPRQQGGTAVGLSHRASAASTRAGKSAGQPPGKGRGELDAYHPFVKASKSSPSTAIGGFSAVVVGPRDRAAGSCTEIHAPCSGLPCLSFGGQLGVMRARCGCLLDVEVALL